MRVLHIGKFYPPFAGGMENYMGDLLPALERRNVHTAAIVHGHEFGRRESYENDAAARIYRVPCYGSFLYAPISPGFAWVLRRQINSFHPDILHMHLPNTSAFLAMAIPSARKVPWVIQWQADIVNSDIDRRLGTAYRLYQPLERRFLKRAAVIIASSPAYFETSVPLASWREKCRIIPLGLDEKRLKMPNKDLENWAKGVWQTGRTRIISVGRLTYYKGHEVLIRAAANLPETHVVIVGEGDRKDYLRGLIRQLGLRGRVELTGFMPDEKLRALLATSDLFCLPSIERTEAFGLVLLEAMRYAKSVVASDVSGSGIGLIIRPMETGLLVNPGDVDDLAGALQLLCKRPDLRQRMSEAGRERFKAVFRIDQVADRITSLYLEVHELYARGRNQV